MDTAVSVRPRWKNPEIQTEVHSERNKSLNVCPVVEDEMDEEDMDDKEEQSEASRAVKVGQKKMMTPTLAEREEHERTHIPCRSWCRHCLHGQAILLIEAGNLQRRLKMSYDYCFMRDQPGMCKDPGVERPCYSHGFCSRGAISGDSTMYSRFGANETRWSGYIEVRSGTSDR